MKSDQILSRVSSIGLVLSIVALLVLAATSPIDRPLWVGVAGHTPNLTVVAWAVAGLVAFFANLFRTRLSSTAKWSVFIATVLVASFPTRWILVAMVGLGEWLPPFGSYLWCYMINPVIAELIIGIIVALLGAFAISRTTSGK